MTTPDPTPQRATSDPAPTEPKTQESNSKPLPDSFAFVPNLGSLLGADAYELLPGYVLRRASESEVVFIKERLVALGVEPMFQQLIWEAEWSNNGKQAVPLSQADWKYFVVAFQGPNALISEIEAAAQMSQVDLDFAFTAVHTEVEGQALKGLITSIRWPAPDVFAVTRGRWSFAQVDKTTVDGIVGIAGRFATAADDPATQDILQRARSLITLKALPEGSTFRVLGYFGALESLLTHIPHPTDPYESITRQIKRKVALLDNRWKPRLDYSPFGNVPNDKVWSTLYSFRSAIAHGRTPDFKGDLKLLKDQELATTFVKTVVKAALRHALIEPQLIADLREI